MSRNKKNVRPVVKRTNHVPYVIRLQNTITEIKEGLSKGVYDVILKNGATLVDAAKTKLLVLENLIKNWEGMLAVPVIKDHNSDDDKERVDYIINDSVYAHQMFLDKTQPFSESELLDYYKTIMSGYSWKKVLTELRGVRLIGDEQQAIVLAYIYHKCAYQVFYHYGHIGIDDLGFKWGELANKLYRYESKKDEIVLYE